ncbi:MAG: hypothetical protein K8R02_06250 [Anaerohalosphaeraceae bacterium]|nr:hypothetical protein [Anaerohalosphaeraceae bacterium]
MNLLYKDFNLKMEVKMKKYVVLLSVLSGVFLLCGAASAADLVNTTFEPNSAGDPSWNMYGPPEYGAWTGQDPCSLVNWSPLSTQHQYGVISNHEPYDGNQCGRQTGSSTGAKFSVLDFCSGTNTGIYTITWYAKYVSRSTEAGNRRLCVKIRNDAGNVSAEINLSEEEGAITYYDSNLGGNAELMDLVDSLWYKFKLELNYGTQKFTLKVRAAGSGDAYTTASDIDFRDATCTSLDRLWCISYRNKCWGYWDDIKVVDGITPDVCGDWGYAPSDLNEDCYVDFKDIAILAENWLDCTDPTDTRCSW